MYLIKLSFKLENNSLPNNINKVFASYLKSCLEHYDISMYKMLFETTNVKKYTFCTKMNSIKYENNRILLADTSLSVEVSDCDLSELFSMYNVFLKVYKEHKPFSMNGNSMILERVRIVPLRFNEDNEALIKMESPLVIRDISQEKELYLSVEDNSFEEKLNENVNLLLKTFKQESVSIKVVKAKKTVVHLYRHKASATLGYLKIEGNPNSIYTLLQCGIGSRRSIGMGKFHIVA